MASEAGFWIYNGDEWICGGDSEGLWGCWKIQTGGELSGDQWIRHHIEEQRESFDVSYPCVGMDSYRVVRQSQLGETWTWFAEWVYSSNMVAAAVDTPCTLETDWSCCGTGAGILVWTCKPFDIWLHNPRVSGSGGSALDRPSDM